MKRLSISEMRKLEGGAKVFSDIVIAVSWRWDWSQWRFRKVETHFVVYGNSRYTYDKWLW